MSPILSPILSPGLRLPKCRADPGTLAQTTPRPRREKAIRSKDRGHSGFFFTFLGRTADSKVPGGRGRRTISGKRILNVPDPPDPSDPVFPPGKRILNVPDPVANTGTPSLALLTLMQSVPGNGGRGETGGNDH